MIKRTFKADGMRGEAWFSPCEHFRYYLSRTWDPALPSIVFLMLNPSTADERVLDPTVARCCSFARRWGYGGIIVVNLFALRSPNPSDLRLVPDPIGADADRVIRGAAVAADVVCAWGTHGTYLDRDRAVWRILTEARPANLWSLHVTKDGHPGHPLYLAEDRTLVPFTIRPEAAAARPARAAGGGGFRPKAFQWRRRR